MRSTQQRVTVQCFYRQSDSVQDPSTRRTYNTAISPETNSGVIILRRMKAKLS